MVYKSKDGEIELSNITRLYPAAVIDMFGEIAEMSLEWMEMNEEKVKLVHFVLVFDFTPLGDDKKVRKVLSFDTKEELIETMSEVAQFFQD
ncbi:MAG: hypothetical protein U9P72_09895 [Campylobacterota bacterium]|nr:hypothetical protein [Campylobacterota bacterium]